MELLLFEICEKSGITDFVVCWSNEERRSLTLSEMLQREAKLGGDRRRRTVAKGGIAMEMK